MAEKKQPIPKRVITEADVDRIMRTAPDYITEASDEVKDLFVAAEWAKEERDLSPKRYFDLVLNEGTEEEKTINIDFQQTVNVGAVVKTHGGDITAVRSANAKRLQYLQLDRAYQRDAFFHSTFSRINFAFLLDDPIANLYPFSRSFVNVSLTSFVTSSGVIDSSNVL